MAVIKSTGTSGRAMFAPAETLPGGYEALSTGVIRDRRGISGRLPIEAHG